MVPSKPVVAPLKVQAPPQLPSRLQQKKEIEDRKRQAILIELQKRKEEDEQRKRAEKQALMMKKREIEEERLQ